MSLGDSTILPGRGRWLSLLLVWGPSFFWEGSCLAPLASLAVGGSLVFIIPVIRTVCACLSFGAVVDELAIVRGGRLSRGSLRSLSLFEYGGIAIVDQSEAGCEIPILNSCAHWSHWHFPSTLALWLTPYCLPCTSCRVPVPK